MTGSTPYTWSDVLPALAAYDALIRRNRSEAWDTIALVAEDATGEVFGEILDSLPDHLSWRIDDMRVEAAFRELVAAYRAFLAAEVDARSLASQTREEVTMTDPAPYPPALVPIAVLHAALHVARMAPSLHLCDTAVGNDGDFTLTWRNEADTRRVAITIEPDGAGVAKVGTSADPTGQMVAWGPGHASDRDVLLRAILEITDPQPF